MRYQQEYFDGQAKRRHRWKRWTRNVSPACFFLSIVAAFSHFLFEWLAGESHEGWLHFLARVFVLLAAALPVLAMGVRTFSLSRTVILQTGAKCNGLTLQSSKVNLILVLAVSFMP